MKKIKSVKHEVKLSYRNSFLFDTLEEACAFMKLAVQYAKDPEYIASFEISPIVEFEEEVEPTQCDTDSAYKEVIVNE